MAGFCIILMGVSGTGKSSVGTALANCVSLLQAQPQGLRGHVRL